QTDENARLQQRNQALAADVTDLKHGDQAIEARARTELGLIKPGETFYQVDNQPAGASSTLPLPPPARPGGATVHGKPVCTAIGGTERSDSVLAGLHALPPEVCEADFVLVHDAARPC